MKIIFNYVLPIMSFFIGGFISSIASSYFIARFVVNKKVEEEIKTLRKEIKTLQNEKNNLISNIDYIFCTGTDQMDYNEIFIKKGINDEVMKYTSNMINKCKQLLFNRIKLGIETNDIFENDWSKPV